MIKSRRLWAGNVTRMEEGRSAFKILTGKSTGKRSLGWPRRRWEEKIIMDRNKYVSILVIVLIRLRIGIIGEPLRMRN